MTLPSGDKPRFLADAMLIRLARWLRVLDFDTRCHPEKTDPELVTLADAEDRWLLTRDKTLVSELRPAKPILIGGSRPLDQLAEVIEACDPPRPKALFRRCIMCNTPLQSAGREEIAAKAPASSQRYQDDILACPDCHRVYWPGSHTRRMTAALRRTLPSWF